jgi:hypothetical protein
MLVSSQNRLAGARILANGNVRKKGNLRTITHANLGFLLKVPVAAPLGCYGHLNKGAGPERECLSMGCSRRGAVVALLGLRSGGEASTSTRRVVRAAIRLGRSGVRMTTEDVVAARRKGGDELFLLATDGAVAVCCRGRGRSDRVRCSRGTPDAVDVEDLPIAARRSRSVSPSLLLLPARVFSFSIAFASIPGAAGALDGLAARSNASWLLLEELPLLCLLLLLFLDSRLDFCGRDCACVC